MAIGQWFADKVSGLFAKTNGALVRTSGDGKLTPDQLKFVSSFVQSFGVDKDRFATVQQALDAIVTSSTWVYICVTKIAKAISSVPLIMQTRASMSDEWEPAPSHPLQALLSRPNDEVSMKRMMSWVVMHQLLTGDAYMLKLRNAGVGELGDITDTTGEVKELWVQWPQNVDAQTPDDVGDSRDCRYIVEYQLTSNRGVEDIPTQNLIHFQLTSPKDAVTGLSPLEAAGTAIGIDLSAALWQLNQFENDCVPSGIFTVKGHVAPEQHEEIRARIEAQYVGALNARRTMLLTGEGMLGEMKYQQLALSAKDADFNPTREVIRAEIIAAFGPPPPVVGLYDMATFNNVSASLGHWWLHDNIPFLTDITETMTHSLVELNRQGLERVWFDKSGIEALAALIAEKIANAKELWAMGVPLNQATAFVGLDMKRVEGGDVGYIPGNLVPSGDTTEL